MTSEQTSFLSLAGASPEQRDALRRSLARLAALDAPHLSPLRGIAERPEGFGLTHQNAPGAVSWAELTARRPATAAETIAVGLALCQALGALHAARLTHGDVCADRVLVSRAGIVELTGCGSAWTAGADLAPTTAGDVRDLVTLLAAGFGPGQVGAGLAGLLERGADPDPRRRPVVPTLGRALEEQGEPSPPFPERFTEPAPALPAAIAEAAHAAPAPSGRRLPRVAVGRNRWPRGLQLAVKGSPRAPGAPRRQFGALALILAAVLGVALLGRGVVALAAARQGPGSQAGAAASVGGAVEQADQPDWRGTVVRLDAMRTAAMTAGSAVRLAVAVDPDGPAYARDVATMTAREHAGLHLVGGGTTVRSAVALQVGTDRAELEVLDTRAAYHLVGPDGQVVLAGPPRSSLSWRVSLVRDGFGQPWRIHDASRR